MKSAKHIGRNAKVAQFELIDGCEGYCLGFNDYRVAGPKPWGGGTALSACHPNKERLLKLIEGKETVTITIVDHGRNGFWIDGVNLSKRGSLKRYNEYLEEMENLFKWYKKTYSRKRCHSLIYKRIIFKVKTEDIVRNINNSYYRTKF